MADQPSNPDSETEEDESAETSKEATVSVPTATTDASATATASVTIGFSADDIEDRLDDDKIAEALLMTSTRLESILSRAIADWYDITNEQFEDLYGSNGLGRHRHVTSVLGLFDQHQDTLNKVVGYRNDLAHDYGYLDTLQTDDDERKEVEAVLEDAVAFIESVEL